MTRISYDSNGTAAVCELFAEAARDLHSRTRFLELALERAAMHLWLQHGIRQPEGHFDHALLREKTESELPLLHDLVRRAESLAETLRVMVATAETGEANVLVQFTELVRQPGSLVNAPAVVNWLRSFSAHIDTTAMLLTGGPFTLLAKDRRGPDVVAGVGSGILRAQQRSRSSLAVTKVRSHQVQAPTTVAQLAQRVPRPNTGDPQVRIERYGSAAQSHWIVYCAGTVTMRANSTSEPWDMTSNLTAMAGHDADSTSAVLSALQQAGVQPNDHVLYVGFSQGGMIAGQLAAEAPGGTADLVTFGAPIAQLDLQSVDGVIAVEHREDLVPALGGADDARDRLVLSASTLNQPLSEPGFAAHDLERYRATTAQAEEYAPLALRVEKHTVLEGFRGTGIASVWRADRVAGP